MRHFKGVVLRNDDLIAEIKMIRDMGKQTVCSFQLFAFPAFQDYDDRVRSFVHRQYEFQIKFLF